MNEKVVTIVEMVAGLGFIIAALFYSQMTGFAINITPAQNEHYGVIIFAIALVLSGVFVWIKFIYSRRIKA